ncbi:hypothetical protein Abu_1561 [Aliarcobacter butzleri RM4018]|uniref:Pentapeptide repeat-containing protein n=1 Tax=Aliarcobacter butzleri (strain RM4018) TaxID=367737 RepID=A8EV36_ALIB4|nr:pentapeptide repeat-containing protein [Aliarcobacter butzleri]ABV67809.1 hypothetical protein Abu_1561 [Aliarcobacter butzleri RM4018]GGT77834.1 hypothetical protein GCM10007985_12440 [Aliarcobacter butzleri]SNV30605.1 Uncharacterised protein [Aliarcobacter butzleri]
MSKNICNVCNKEFEDKYFDKKQNKCILHCEKDGWYEIDDSGNKNWYKSKGNINLFWEKFYEEYDSRQILFGIKNVVFPKFESQGGLAEGSSRKIVFEEIDNSLTFENCTFEGKISLYKYINKLEFKECKFLANLELSRNDIQKGLTFINCTFNKNLILKNLTFKIGSKLRIKDCSIIKNVNFENTTFEDLADFNKTRFNEINFYKTTFKDISVFTETIFNKKVDFKHTTFEKLSIFRNSEFKDSINLKDAIFKEKANFLEIKTDVSNRETARIIKDSFEQQNNIIEANKYYALEMKEREKELDFKKDFFEWLVFKIHGLSSNHSQDWTLALFWIINLTFFYSYLNIQPNDKILVFKIIFSFIAIILITCMIIKIPKNLERRWLTTIPTTIICYVLYGYLVETDWSLAEFSKNLNPFSIMRGDEPITLGTLIFKIIIAYLIYQLIISIRQNTRRK